MIAFSCSSCQKKLTVQETLVGKQVRCSGCGQVITVPVPVSAAPAAQAVPLPPVAAAALGRRPAASDALTYPPSGNPDATEGVGSPGAAADIDLAGLLTPPQAADELGRLGKYRVLKVLGKGGMGIVFLAEDPKLKRKLAIKAMLPALAANASAGARFLREAQAMAAVEHDHVATIFQVDEERGVPFLAMGFLKGESLEERLKRDGKLRVRAVLRTGREIAEGLEAAHATGLIHRDIKPANIWLEAPKGRVKILDFGLARAASQDASLTQQGVIVGTPAYMAPEQGRGETVDARCDLFSLGCVLYRMAVGQPPFKGKDTISTLLAVARDQPHPPSMVDAAIPEELSALVMHLLEKDASRRPASAGTVADTLRVLEVQLPGGEGTMPVPRRLAAAPGPRPGRRKVVLLAIGLLVLLVGGGMLARMMPRDHPSEAMPAAARREVVAEVADPDRRAAEWVLSIGGSVWVREDDEDRKIKVVTELPQEPFRLTVVWLQENKQTSDAGLVCFEGCMGLTGIDLGGTQVTDAGMTHFKHCKHLAQLSLYSTHVSDAGLAYFKDCKRLTVLSLGDTQVTDAGLALFKDCKSLTYLNLGGTQISDAGLAVFKDCKDLTYLHLGHTRISDAGLAYFGGCKNLTNLLLDRTRVSDAGLAYFKDCKDLTQLFLGGTQVSDAGLAHFKDCKDLMQLSLYQTPVTGAGLAYLKDCKNLTKLNLFNTMVSDLSPLKQMPLGVLACDFKPERDADILRSIRTLKTINGKPASDFWKEIDAK